MWKFKNGNTSAHYTTLAVLELITDALSLVSLCAVTWVMFPTLTLIAVPMALLCLVKRVEDFVDTVSDIYRKEPVQHHQRPVQGFSGNSGI